MTTKPSKPKEIKIQLEAGYCSLLRLTDVTETKT